MFARYSKQFILLVLATAAWAVVSCRSASAVVISQEFDLPIPSLNDPCIAFGKGRMDDAIINVTKHLLIEDLDVAVSLEHEAFFDLEIVLQGPSGTTIKLNPSPNYAFIIQDENHSHTVGGSNRFLFDDEAITDIKHAVQPLDQAFKPTPGFELSIFDGQDAFGQWRLQINDLWASNTGQFVRVELIIRTPEPTTISFFTLAAVVARLLKPRKILR
jgi:subtilisin-like proprotein convertase family protein